MRAWLRGVWADVKEHPFVALFIVVSVLILLPIFELLGPAGP